MFSFTNQKTEITYVLVGKRPIDSNPLFPPSEFDNYVIDFIADCPQDLLQLNNTIKYINAKINSLLHNSIQFRFVYEEDSIAMIKELDKSKVFLFFFSESLKVKDTLLDIFKNQNDMWYYHLIDEDILEKPAGNNEVFNPTDFVYKLITNFDKIKSTIDFEELRIELTVPIELGALYVKNHFSLGILNTKILNGILGNYGYAQSLTFEANKSDAILASKDSLRKFDSFDRQYSVLDIIDKIDTFFLGAVENEIKPISSQIDNIFAPLILVSPYNNPGLFNLKESTSKEDKTRAEFAKFLSTEQSNNYTFPGNSKSFDYIKVGVPFIKQRIKYLDNVAFLHSTFTHSPIIRLPLKGSSLNRELSFFRTEMHNDIGIKKIRLKLKNTITNIGRKLNMALLSERLENLLIEKNRQIIVISDLPIEWMVIDDVPLAFSHDVCRIPEISPSGIMSLFMSSSFISFEIQNEILKETLIICGSNESSFQNWQNIAKDSLSELECSFAVCLSLNELKDTIDFHKPKFVIFDCHGGIDEKSKSTFLWFGDEKLTGDYIISNGISIPLIFLSACGTSPSYGIYNSIANAFFHTGSISVTSTYLPILVDTGSHLYIRILRLLKESAVNGLHSNWLSFISHVLRTSIFHEAYSNVTIKNEEEVLERAKILSRAMIFSERADLYYEIEEQMKGNSKIKKLTQGVPEYLFYTNLGRSDLIFFKSWKDKFEKDSD